MRTRDLRYRSTVDGIEPLHAYVAIPEMPGRRPVIAVMHGYNGAYQNVTESCERLARKGFFAVAPDMRGRAASAGVPDIGAVEIHDIVDAIGAALRAFPEAGDAENINLLGYSGGGGNVFSAVVRFPTLFRVAVAFFGISDYGWWHDHIPSYQSQVAAHLGGSPRNLPAQYAVRNSLLAAGNNPDTRLHLFWDHEEQICPGYFNEEFARLAVAHGCSNVRLHQSFPGDADRWIHGYPEDNGALARAEALFLPEIAAATAPAPRLRPEGKLVIPGYLVTPQLEIWLGDGRAAVADLTYRFTARERVIHLKPRLAAEDVRARMSLDLAGLPLPAVVEIDGMAAARITDGTRWDGQGLPLACSVRITSEI